ncbi:MAG: LicD family protein [Planctomycetes bacterium]|nr:LicD family protein [Planctomycetota bacterium]
MDKIETANGVIEFEEKIFSEDKAPLDQAIGKANLLDVRRVLAKHDVKFGLIYGTLLGAIREKGFIPHDQDIDLFMLAEDREKLLNSLHDLLDCGFQVCRYDGIMLSIIRDEEYIDFYFFRKGFFQRKCSPGLTARSSYLEKTREISFLGESFHVPHNPEKMLVFLYGKNWKVPRKNDPSMNHHPYIILRETLKAKANFLFQIGRWIKKHF